MDQSLKITNLKIEPTESSSTDLLKIPIEMQLNPVKQESVCLDQSEIYIKTEPKEDENEFPVTTSTYYEVYSNYEIEMEEPLIKIKCQDLESEIMQDPLDVSIEIKDEEQFPIDLKQGEPRIKIEPIEGNKDENPLETDLHESRSNQDQEQLLIKNDPYCKDNKYICNVCNRTFTLNKYLNKHLRIHTGEKPFECNICEKSFNEKSNLNKHMRIHSGEKPYVCDVCKKGFSRKSHLNDHKGIHSSLKPFSCYECGKSFTQKTSLMVHKRMHTGEKPFVCDFCDKTFTVISNLNRHRRRHIGEKPYSCNICNKLFADQTNLIRHKKNHKN